MPTYEVWSMATNRLAGTIEINQTLSGEPGQRVNVKIKGTVTHDKLGTFNAIQMLACRMKSEGKYYMGLESNAPMWLLHKCEGFVPKVATPTLSEIWTFGGRNEDRR